MLLQWVDARKRVARAGKRPSVQQFSGVQVFPLQNVRQGPLREVTVDLPGADLNGDLEFAIDRMEVWRIVITVVHRNDDPEKTAELRHQAVYRGRRRAEKQAGRETDPRRPMELT